MVEWGVDSAHLRRLLPGLSCDRSETNSDYVVCSAFAWEADFGETGHDLATVLGLGDGRFFRYTVFFDPDRDYDMVRTALVKALGPPDDHARSVVENRMGARFDQERLAWRLADVDVEIEKRGSTVDQGSMSAEYKPLRPPPAEDRSTAPF